MCFYATPPCLPPLQNKHIITHHTLAIWEYFVCGMQVVQTTGCVVQLGFVWWIEYRGLARDPANVRQLYDVWKFSASQISALRWAVTQNPV